MTDQRKPREFWVVEYKTPKRRPGRYAYIKSEGIRLTLNEFLVHVREVMPDDNSNFVPGLLECKKCGFVLVSQNLYVKSGTVGPNNKPDDCANGCGPMWKVTWKQRAQTYYENLETMWTKFDRVTRALEKAKEIIRSATRDHAALIEGLEAIERGKKS